MGLLNEIREYASTNSDKRIAMFVDMDGVIANLEIDMNNSIVSNKKNLFFNKKPIMPVIDMLHEVSEIVNIDLYILSACVYKEQAIDKSRWLDKYAPFFKVDNQIFIIKEVVNYTHENKCEIKVGNIVSIMESKCYDLAIYFEDEYLMLRKAYKLLGDKVFCIHISNFIE